MGVNTYAIYCSCNKEICLTKIDIIIIQVRINYILLMCACVCDYYTALYFNVEKGSE